MGGGGREEKSKDRRRGKLKKKKKKKMALVCGAGVTCRRRFCHFGVICLIGQAHLRSQIPF